MKYIYAEYNKGKVSQEKEWNFNKFSVEGEGRLSTPFYIYIKKRDIMFEYTGDKCSVPKDITSVQFKEGLQNIGDNAFDGCKSLESIKLPSTLVEIGFSAFYGCRNLKEVTFNEGLRIIGFNAFVNCTSLQSILLPSTVTEIGDFAFHGCSNLTKVILNEGLKKIEDGAFSVCSSLKSIKLPSTVTEIGDSPFDSCSNLTEVKLFSCSNLTEVIFDNLQSNLTQFIFNNCVALERILFPTISYRLGNIIQTSHWEDLEDKVNEVRGVVQWESNQLFVSRATLHNWNETKRDLGRITQLVSYYERKEATSTFELALWKSKLDQVDATNTTNRAAYRIDVPGPVRATILQYL